MANLEYTIKFLDPIIGYAKAEHWGSWIDILSDARELLTKQQWIPANEKLPKSMANKVIVYLKHEDLVPKIGYGHYEKFQGEEMWYDLETDEQFTKRGYTVTHWMPMPTSPEGETLILC